MKTPLDSKEVVLVSGEKDIRAKLAYIEGAYNDNLIHKKSEKTSIIDVKIHTHEKGMF